MLENKQATTFDAVGFRFDWCTVNQKMPNTDFIPHFDISRKVAS